VVLISRNQQKLDNLRNEIISTYPSAQLKVIIADFSIHGEQFYRGIFEHIKDLDISLLVNNVGMS
jgi:17beta-estradiol 17-dehydrogenase / very-long-chain 3-oxoacyl-CoA reductase